MNAKPIIQKGHKTLAQISKEVPAKFFGAEKFTSEIDTMFDILENTHDGIALAAPQVNIPYRFFIVSDKIFDQYSEETPLVYINPEIISQSKDKKKMDEGCLSLHGMFGHVRRASRTTVRAFDEHGNEFEVEGSGLLSQIFQHEIDHLDGILFDSKAVDIRREYE